jgi:polyferredoxin
MPFKSKVRRLFKNQFIRDQWELNILIMLILVILISIVFYVWWTFPIPDFKQDRKKEEIMTQ